MQGMNFFSEGPYIFFHRLGERNEEYSNWYPCIFVDDLGITYYNTEQYIMYHKALLFNDSTVASSILETKDPVTIKDLGRKVKGYNDSKWAANRYEIAVKGNYYKFKQNKDLHDLIVNSNGIFAECASNDLVWGIGIGLNNQDKFDTSKWRGQNLLGQCLTTVRDMIKQEDLGE